MSSHFRDRVNQLVSYIKQGKIMEAMEEFYHTDAAMQENRNEPTRGLDALIEHEKKFLSGVKDFKGFDATAVGVQDGDGGNGKALVECWFEFINTHDQFVRLEQVTVQHWRDGKIEFERFYYDSAG